MRKMSWVRGRKVFRIVAVFSVFVAVLAFAGQPTVTKADTTAVAFSAGFGAAFGYAQTIGPISFAESGSIGNAFGAAIAVVPGSSSAASLAASLGNAASFAQAIGSPFGSNAFVQTASFFGGAAFGIANATP